MPPSTPVSAVMTTDVLSFGPDDDVRTAMEALVSSGVDGAPVVDDVGRVVGILTTADLMMQAAEIHFPTLVSILGATLERPKEKRQFDRDIEKALGASVGEVMNASAVTIAPEETIEQAATLMHDHDVSRLPVVGDEGLVGIIGRTDILRSVIQDKSSPDADDQAD